MIWRRIWPLSWLLLASICLYLLCYSWHLNFLTLMPVNTITLVNETMAKGDLAQAADLVKYCQEVAPEEQQEALRFLESEIQTRRSSLDYQVQHLVTNPLLNGVSDEVAGQTVVLASSLFLWGDLRDLGQQALRYFDDQPIDEWVVTLSALGIAASLAQSMSMGTATPTKAGLALLSLAHKTNAMTAKFRRYFLMLVDKVRDTRSLDPVLPTLHRLTQLFDQAGLPAVLVLLSRVHGPGDLNRLIRLTQHFGPATSPLIQVGGEGVLRVAHAVDRLGGPEVIKAASRYGPQGIRTLGLVGPVKFAKYGARLAKLGYQFPWLQWLAKALLRLPTWVLLLGTTLGLLFGLPWPWRKVFS